MLSLLPDWIWHLLTLAGIGAVFAAMVLPKVAFVSQYKLALKYGGIVAVLFGVWMEGGIVNEAKWQARVQELEAKVAASEIKSEKENVKIVTKTVVKREYYRTRGNDIIQYVDREITKYDNTCPVPKEVVAAHNKAATKGDTK